MTPQTLHQILVLASFSCFNISAVPWLPWHFSPPRNQKPRLWDKERQTHFIQKTGHSNSTCFQVYWCLALPAYFHPTTLDQVFPSQIHEASWRWVLGYWRRKSDSTLVTNCQNHLLTLCAYTSWSFYSVWVFTILTLLLQFQWSIGRMSSLSSTLISQLKN